MVRGGKKIILSLVMAGGLINLFRYVPILVTLRNLPFPFEHLYNVIKTEKGTRIQFGYLPMQEAMSDPYWLMWSLALYLGIAIIVFAVWRKRK